MGERPLTKWDHIYYALIAGTILSFALALLGFVGEHLGWNDLGEASLYAGTAMGVVLGATTVVVGSSRSQVEATRETLGATKAAVEDNGGTLDSVDDRLASVDRETSRRTAVLEEIRNRL